MKKTLFFSLLVILILSACAKRGSEIQTPKENKAAGKLEVIDEGGSVNMQKKSEGKEESEPKKEIMILSEGKRINVSEEEKDSKLEILTGEAEVKIDGEGIDIDTEDAKLDIDADGNMEIEFDENILE